MTETTIHRNFRPDVRAERKRQSAYAPESKNNEMFLTMKYGGDWMQKLSTEFKAVDGTGRAFPKPQETLTEEQAAALEQEAAARFEQISADDDALNNAYDVFKGGVRAALSVSDTSVDVFRNRALGQLMDTMQFVDNPSVNAAKKLLDQQRWADAAYNTTLWTQIDAARKGGFQAGFGAEGTGSGFFIGLESPVQQEKNRRAYEFASLGNGDAASFGRLAAESVGFSKGSDPYSWMSGLIDAATIVAFDPLTYATGGGSAVAKAPKAAKVLKGLGLAPDEIAQVSRAIEHLGGVAGDEDVTSLLGKVMQARTKLRMQGENPDLIKSKRAAWQDEELRKAAQNTARLNEFAVDSRVDLETFRGLGDEVDAAVKRVNAAMDDQVRRDLAAGRGDTRFDPDTELPFDTVDAAAQEARATDEYFRLETQLMESLKAKGVDLKDIDPEEWVAMLKAYSGFSSKGFDARQAVHNFIGGDFDSVAKLVARTGDPADLYDLFPHFGSDTLRMLSRTTDEHETYTVLLNGILHGDVTRAGSRVARWAVMHGQSGAPGAAFAKRVTRFSRDAVPSPSMVSFENHDEMTKIASDFITEAASMAYRKTNDLKGWEDFRRTWVGEMINATDAVSRKRVWIEMQQRLLDRIPGWHKLDEDHQKAARELFAGKWDKDASQKARTASIRAQLKQRGKKSMLVGLSDDPMKFDEQYAGLINYLVDLSDNVAMNDPKYLRKLFNVIDDAGNLSAKGRAVSAATMINDAFDSYLRPLYLAFRPGYAILQIMDSGMRALLMGSTNLLTSPLQTMAIAAHLTLRKNSRALEVIDKIIKTAPTNPDGTAMFGRAQISALDDYTRHIQDTHVSDYLRRGHLRDVLTGDDSTARNLIDLGWKEQYPGDENFIRGWADMALLHMTPGEYGDVMFQDVFDTVLDGKIPQRIQDWANQQYGRLQAGANKLTDEEMITEYYFRGPGREQFHKLAASAQTHQSKVPLMQQIVNDKSKLHSFLWDQDEALSVYNLVDDMTGHFDPKLMRTLREASQAKGDWITHLSTMSPSKAKKMMSGKGRPVFIREITLPDGTKARVNVARSGDLEQTLRRVLSRTDEDSRPLVTRYRDKAAHDESNWKEKYQEALSWFFSHAGFLEKRMGQAPILRDDILLESAKRAVFLSPEDAAVMQQRILSQMPKLKRTAKQREAAAILKSGVREANGSGAYTLEDLTEAAHNAAFRKLSESMYGMRGRNAAAQRTALFLPFAQSWVNASRVYLQESVRHPNRAFNALRLLRTAQSSESGVIYDTLPGVDRDDDPSKPLFWADGFGNRQVSIPYLGYAAHIVDSGLSKFFGTEQDPNFQPYLNLRVDRWNPLNFGEPLPGVGYGVTIPAAVIESRVGPMQDDLRKWVFAMDGTDTSQRESGIEAAQPWFMKLVWPSDDKVEAQLGNAILALAANNPEKYLGEGGYVRADMVGELTADAEALAQGLARGNIWRAAVFRGGTTIPKSVNSDGESIALAALSVEFERVVEETGSVQEGYAFLVDKYGPQGLAYLVGTRDRTVGATDEGYKFAQDNPELFDATSDVLGYFFPASDLSGDPNMRLRSPGYQRMLTESGKGRVLTPEEWAAEYNRRLKGVRDLRLEQKFIKGEITQSQYETEKALIAKDYQLVPSPGFDSSHRDKIHAQFKEALNNPTLANTPSGKALSQYLSLYDQAKMQAEGGSLDGEGDAPIRAALRQQGEQLSEIVPEFRPMWRGQLLWEVDE